MRSLFDMSREEVDVGGRIQGVSVGVVTKNNDDEGLARVKVRLPWYEEGDESYWARVATPMAGGGRGAFFIPEVGDEVLVAADQGDPEHLYVIGSLWNGVDPPPGDNKGGSNDLRKIRSRAGHELSFDDADPGSVTVKHASGTTVILNRDTLEVRAGRNEIVIDTTAGSVTLRGTTSLSIEAPRISIKADAELSIQTNGALTLKGTVVSIN